jgi:hypothetical protein
VQQLLSLRQNRKVVKEFNPSPYQSIYPAYKN